MRKQLYLSALEMKGLASHGRVDWDSLARAIRHEYDNFDGLPFKDRIISSQRCPMRWLRDLCMRPDRALHPLCHLLFIGSVYGTLEAFRSFAGLSWPVVVDVPPGERIPLPPHRLDSFGLLIEDRSLTCRQVAKVTGVSTTTVVTRRRELGMKISERYKVIDQSKLNEVNQLLVDGHAIAQVALQTNLSLSSIYRILATQSEIRSKRVAAVSDAMRVQYRAQWLDAKTSSPVAGTKQLRVHLAAAYIWLYRHDFEWLSANVPPRSRSTTRASRVNWADRDRSFAQAVERKAERAALVQDGIKLSAAELLRATGFAATARRNLTRLPILALAIRRFAEDDETFCNRRHKYARACLTEVGHVDPQEWRVEKISSIRKRKSILSGKRFPVERCNTNHSPEDDDS